MPGRRNHDGEPPRSLGEQLKGELRAIVQIWLKNTARHTVPLLQAPDWISFQPGFHIHCVVAPLSPSTIQVSPNAVRFARPHSSVRQAALWPPGSARIRTETATVIPALRHMPILEAGQTRLSLITELFPPNASVREAALPLVKAQTLKTVSQGQELRLGGGKNKSLSVHFKRTTPHSRKQTLMHPPPLKQNIFPIRLLPIQKAPIPLHRFSLQTRHRFREMLAEKSGARAGQIQLVLIFDRIHMALYSGIRKDDRSNLLCTLKTPAGSGAPKHENPAPESGGMNAYLLIGLNLETRQEVRALFPMSDIPVASDAEERASHD